MHGVDETVALVCTHYTHSGGGLFLAPDKATPTAPPRNRSVYTNLCRAMPPPPPSSPTPPPRCTCLEARNPRAHMRPPCTHAVATISHSHDFFRDTLCTSRRATLTPSSTPFPSPVTPPLPHPCRSTLWVAERVGSPDGVAGSHCSHGEHIKVTPAHGRSAHHAHPVPPDLVALCARAPRRRVAAACAQCPLPSPEHPTHTTSPLPEAPASC